MQTREAIQSHIRSAGEEVSRWRAWGYKAASDPTPLLREHRPSGYENWFVVEKGKAIGGSTQIRQMAGAGRAKESRSLAFV